MRDLMQYKGYYGSAHFDENDLIFHGKLEIIRALVSYEATDAKGLKDAFIEAVDDYLQTCRRNNIEPESPFKGSLNVRLGHDLHRDVAIAAAHEDGSINKFIYDDLDKAVRKSSI